MESHKEERKKATQTQIVCIEVFTFYWTTKTIPSAVTFWIFIQCERMRIYYSGEHCLMWFWFLVLLLSVCVFVRRPKSRWQFKLHFDSGFFSLLSRAHATVSNCANVFLSWCFAFAYAFFLIPFQMRSTFLAVCVSLWLCNEFFFMWVRSLCFISLYFCHTTPYD